MSGRRLTLTAITGSFAICRLEPTASIPEWATDGAFFSITRTAFELSIVCEVSAVPVGVIHEPGWKCFQLRGPFAFTEVGVLAALIGPLASAGISIFAVSTFETDCLMVQAETEAAARAALTAAGHIVES